jgi:putative SOS response-associated peptidase YedK
MPLILRPEAIDEWLNPSIEEYDKLNAILKNGRETEVKSYPVSKFVDIPTNNDVRCIQPAAN